MSQQWFYQHEGQTHGPVSSEQIKELGRRGLLKKTDLLWAEGASVDTATPAHGAMDFNKLPLVSFPAPDWLADVEKTQRIGPLPPIRPSKEVPEWLEDLRLWVTLDLMTRAKERQKDSAGPSSPPAKKPHVSPSAPPVTEKAKTAAAPTKPATGPTATPAITAPPVSAAAPPFAPTPPAMPAAPPEPGPALLESPRPAAVLAEKLLLETGFDLETGQILDAAKFARWKQQKASQETASAVSNASLFEVFRKARTAIENWVDDDLNREAVMHSSLKQIERRADVGLILGKYENYGPAMRNKLVQHLEFMVENRKKYYTARSN